MGVSFALASQETKEAPPHRCCTLLVSLNPGEELKIRPLEQPAFGFARPDAAALDDGAAREDNSRVVGGHIYNLTGKQAQEHALSASSLQYSSSFKLVKHQMLDLEQEPRRRHGTMRHRVFHNHWACWHVLDRISVTVFRQPASVLQGDPCTLQSPRAPHRECELRPNRVPSACLGG